MYTVYLDNRFINDGNQRIYTDSVKLRKIISAATAAAVDNDAQNADALRVSLIYDLPVNK